MKKHTQEYKDSEDRLSRIFIRVQDASGKWDNTNLNEVTDEQFEEWFKNYLFGKFEFECEETVCRRVGMVEYLDEVGIPPVEIKKGFKF